MRASTTFGTRSRDAVPDARTARTRATPGRRGRARARGSDRGRSVICVPGMRNALSKIRAQRRSGSSPRGSVGMRSQSNHISRDVADFVIPRSAVSKPIDESLARVTVSARRHLGRRRRQFRAVLRACDPRRAVPVRFPRRGKRVADDPADRADRHGLARLPARRAARASSTAIACTGRTRRTTATASIPTRSCWIRTRASSARRAAVARIAVRLPHRRGRRDVRRPRQRRVRAARGRRRRRLHLGRTIGRCARRGTRRSSTSCT